MSEIKTIVPIIVNYCGIYITIMIPKFYLKKENGYEKPTDGNIEEFNKWIKNLIILEDEHYRGRKLPGISHSSDIEISVHKIIDMLLSNSLFKNYVLADIYLVENDNKEYYQWTKINPNDYGYTQDKIVKLTIKNEIERAKEVLITYSRELYESQIKVKNLQSEINNCFYVIDMLSKKIQN